MYVDYRIMMLLVVLNFLSYSVIELFMHMLTYCSFFIPATTLVDNIFNQSHVIGSQGNPMTRDFDSRRALMELLDRTGIDPSQLPTEFPQPPALLPPAERPPVETGELF